MNNIVNNDYVNLKQIANDHNLNINYIVDIGASIINNQNNILNFFMFTNVNGLLIEGDKNEYNKIINFINNSNDYINKPLVHNDYVTPNNIINIFKTNNVPENIDILKIDIDSYDLDILETILANNYTATIIQMELQFEIPPPLKFNCRYNSNWQRLHKGLYGSSLSAQYDVLKKYNYELYNIIKVNGDKSAMHDAIYINKRNLPNDFILKDLNILYSDIIHNNLQIIKKGKFGIDFHNLLFDTISKDINKASRLLSNKINKILIECGKEISELTQYTDNVLADGST